jgi:hypothetical protein
MQRERLSILAIIIALFLVVPEAANADTHVAEGERAIDLVSCFQGRGDLYNRALKAKLKNPGYFSDYDQLACMKYLVGIGDANSVYIGMDRPGLFCFPKTGLPVEQQVRIFEKWMKQHPELLYQSAKVAVFHAFIANFPCR